MRKKVIFLLAFGLLTCGFAMEKGTKTLGGMLSFSSANYFGDTVVTNLSFAPNLGICVVDNLLIEVSPKFTLQAQKNFPDETEFSLGVGGRYFIGGFYLGAMFNFNQFKQAGFKSSSRDLDLKAGYLLPLAKNIYLDLAANYNIGIGRARLGDDTYRNDIAIFSLAVGVAAFFK